MARAVRKKELTAEERLAAALVPEEEQPYKVPGNWCWVYHNSILDISGGSQPNKSYFVSEPQEGYIQLYQTRDYGEKPVPVYIPESYATKKTEEGDILLARYGGSLGKVFKAHRGAYNVALAKVVKLYDNMLNDEYIFKYYQSFFYQDFCVKAAKGRSAQAGYNRSDMDVLVFPLPPLPEQQRIVTLIESLFADLDEAKEKLTAVVEGFAQRKAAILHQAFTGELTAKWREENGIVDNGHIIKRFDEVAEIKSNLVDPKEYQDYPHIAPDNIEKKTGRLLEFNTIAEDKVKSGKHRFYSGQILYSKIRPYLSKVVLIDFDGLCSADMYPIEAKEGIDVKYLWYYMLSDDFLIQASSAGSRSVLPKINQKEMSSISVAVTDINEQREIVRILDNLFEQEQQAQSAVETVLSDIDTLKKSILARAFRGELSTNNPKEENAVEMLKTVLM